MFDSEAVEEKHKYVVDTSEEVLTLDVSYGENVRIKIHGIKNQQMGGFGAKSFIEGTFLDKDGKETQEKIAMLLKRVWVNEETFGDEKEGMSFAKRYVERWKFLRDLGVPVAPNIVALDNNVVAMLNVTDGGGSFFGKEKYTSLNRECDNKVKRKLTKEEQSFLLTDLNKLDKEIARVQSIMDRNGIDFPDDDPFEVFVSPEGEWKFLVWDLSWLGKTKGRKINREGERGSMLLTIDNMKKSLQKIGSKL